MGFEDIIRDKLSNHESPVPPNAWDNINKKKNRRRFVIIWWSSLLLLLICGITATKYFINNSKKEKLIAKNELSKTNNERRMTNDEQSITNDEQQTMNNKKLETKNKKGRKIDEQLVSDDEQQITNYKKLEPKSKKGKLEVGLSGGAIGENDIAVNKNEKIKNNNEQLMTNDEERMMNNRQKTTNNKKLQTKNKKAKIKAWQSGGAISENDIAVNKNEKIKRDNEQLAIDNEQQTANNEPQSNSQKQETINEKEVVTADEKQKTLNSKPQTKNEKPTTKNKSINIDISITPLLPLQHYDANVSFIRTLNENNSVSIFNSSSVKTTITPSLAFSVGIHKQISKKISVGTGLQYVQLKENIQIEGEEKNTSFTIINRLINGSNGPQLVPDTIETTTEGIRNITAINSYQLFSVPVFMQYNLLQRKRWAIQPITGVYINIASSYQNEINRNATSLLINNATTNKNSVAFDVLAAVRISKVIGKKIEMFTMPALRWNIGQYNIKNSLINKNIHQAACSFGLTYRLK